MDEKKKETSTNLERSFWEDIKNQCRFMVVCGRKASGKSHLITNFIAIALQYDLYDEYHLVIPELNTDHDSSNYAFIKNNAKCILYEKFQPHMVQLIKELSKTKRLCFAMDDATGYMFANKHNEDLLTLLSTTRHGKGCQVIIVSHALKNILQPVNRALIDHLFCGSFTNYNLIKSNLYEENCSMIMPLNDFITQYKEHIIQEDHNFLYMNIKCQVDFHVNQWNLSKYDRKTVQPNGKAKIMRHDPDYELKQRYTKLNKANELKSRIVKKPEKKTDIFNLRFVK